MNRRSWAVICIAYPLGLLSTGVFGFPPPHPSWQQWTVAIGGLGILSLVAASFAPRLWRRGPGWPVWLVAGLVAILAVFYLQVRTPQPARDDISQLLTNKSGSRFLTVTGKVLTEGRETESQRIRFWLAAEKVEYKSRKEQKKTQVRGKLYVTVPLKQGQEIYPSQRLAIAGILYQPKSPANPGVFDFKTYLAREGCFAGLKGFKVRKIGKPAWGFWLLRERIVRAQVEGLGNQIGPLVSSIVLGQKAVDLPPKIRRNFTKAGLAHTLAASGFQVALLLGVIIPTLRGFTPQIQLAGGLGILILYICLTGFQPSIFRAGLMGAAALIGLVYNRKVRPLGALLLSGVLLLVWNPLWIWNLSFQLSFLATLGLMVTMPALQQRLNWLPSHLASAVALPLAASLWTLPLLMQTFSVISTYSIPVNIIATLLVTFISLLGAASAAIGIIFPFAGSGIAVLLYYPTLLLLKIVDLAVSLPGSYYAVGKLPLGIMALIYALMVVTWLNPWWQRRWWIVGLAILTLIIVPILSSRFLLSQVTFLATKSEPVIIIQDRGKIALINSGDRETAKYTILPFLAQQGINQIDCAIALNSPNKKDRGWSEIKNNLSIRRSFSPSTISASEFEPLPLGNSIGMGETKIKLINSKPLVLQWQISNLTSWLLGQKKLTEMPPNLEGETSPQVLVWPGKVLPPAWLEIARPQVAIAVSRNVDFFTQQQLKTAGVKLYWTGREGAIQWTHQRGFQKVVGDSESTNSWF
jgi:competence protein ComEC